MSQYDESQVSTSVPNHQTIINELGNGETEATTAMNNTLFSLFNDMVESISGDADVSSSIVPMSWTEGITL